MLVPVPGLAEAFGSIENLVPLTPPQFQTGSLILMVSYGAHFAFVIYFLMMAQQLAPRYRIVAVLSAVVMASAGLSLLAEANLWQKSYGLVGATYVPLAEDSSFTNAFRYGNWTITVPLLLTQLAIAFGVPRPDLHRRCGRMIAAALLMIWTGLYGQFGETGDWVRLNLWGLISTGFFVWLLVEVRGVVRIGVSTSPAEIKRWPDRLWWYFLATWGLYPIAYALPQLGFTAEVVLVRQFLFSLADVSTKLVYGVILSRYLLRRSALEGYAPAAEALGTQGEASAIASQRGD